MNVDTGELIRLRNLSPEIVEAMGFVPVPKEHEAEANRIIEEAEANRRKAFADMTADTPLVQWARAHNKKNPKSKRKMINASRRKNH